MLASSKIIGDDVQYEIEKNIGIKPLVILVPSAEIKEALESLYSTDLDIIELLNTKRIGERLGEILVKLNVINNNQLEEIITSYNLDNYDEVAASIISDSPS